MPTSEETDLMARLQASLRPAREKREREETEAMEEALPSILLGQDGEPPMYVNGCCAATPEEAIAFARDQGEYIDGDIDTATQVSKVLMRKLGEIACEIRGVEYPWWVECSARAKKAVSFWRIDA